MIPYGGQSINQNDIDAVVEVLRSDFLTQGPKVPEFEQAFIDHCQVNHAIAVNSATSALHIACVALGVTKGDLVWTSPISFVASANCVLYCGAKIDFVDIDPITYNLSTTKLKEKLETARANNQQLPKVIIPVHLSGQSCDMAGIYKLSKQYGFSIIEDAAHAIGGQYLGKPVGNCQYSDITIFSFHPVKIITTAEGGLATTNKPELADKMQLLRGHGITRNSDEMIGEPHGDWYYQQITLGFNYRMTELQAALGISQFTRLSKFVERRNKIAEHYDQSLKELPITLPCQTADTKSSRHLYIIRLKLQELRTSHKEIFSALRGQGIGVNLHYIPIYSQPHFQQFGYQPEDFPEAERYYAEAISIPLFSQMTEKQVMRVIEVIDNTLMGR